MGLLDSIKSLFKGDSDVHINEEEHELSEE